MASAKLFVGCLPYSTQENELAELFGQFGALQEVVLLKKPDGSSKGAAFVAFQDSETAATAMMYLNGHLFEGSNRGINISLATSGGPGGGGGPRAAQPALPQAPPRWSPSQAAQPMYPGQPPPPAAPAPQAYMMPPQAQVSAAPGCKLFVGQLPYSKTDADLWQLFGSVGPVTEVTLLRDKGTGQPKGAAFVRYQSSQGAMAAVAVLDGFLFEGSPRAITVSLAKGDQGAGTQFPAAADTGVFHQPPPPTQPYPGQQPQGVPLQAGVRAGEGCKLFVGQLPFSRGEQEIAQVFSQYGQVLEVFLHRDAATGQKKGGAFVIFASSDSAVGAMELDGYLFEGSTRPICVAMAGENKRRRIA